MFLRIKKEVQPLWLPLLVAALTGALIPLKHLLPAGTALGILSFELAPMVFAGSFALLCALSFGTEFQSRTLALYLSQPLSRARLWCEKMAVLGLCGASVLLVVAGAALYGNGNGWVESWQVLVPVLLVIALLCSSSFWTLLAGTTIGGMVFGLTGVLLAGIATENLETEIAQRRDENLLDGSIGWSDPLWCGLALAYSALFLWLGFRKFARFELRQPLAAGAGTALGSKALGKIGRPKLLRFAPDGALGNLLRKELLLHKPVLSQAALFVVCWALILVLGMAHMLKPVTVELLFGVLTCLYMAIALCLSGCISLGEEKGLGIHSWQLTFPVSPGLQWAAKALVAVTVGMVLGVVLPLVLSWATAAYSPTPLMQALKNPHGGMLLVLICAGGLVASFWAATLCSSTVRAAAACFVILTAVLGIVMLSSWASQQIGGAQFPLLMALASRHHTQFSAYVISDQFLALIAFFAVIVFMLLQSRVLFRHSQTRGRTAWFSSALLGLVVFCVSFWAIDYQVSADAVQRAGANSMRELTEALMALPAPHPGQSNKQIVSLSELERTGMLSYPTLKWLDSATIWITLVGNQLPGHRPVYLCHFDIPGGLQFEIPFQPASSAR